MAHLFDDPPLIGNEKREDFDKFFAAIAEAVTPADDIAWLLTYDVVCHSWDIRRERMIKTNIIKSAQVAAVVDVLTNSDNPFAIMSVLTTSAEIHDTARRWLDDADEETTQTLKQRGYGHAEILANAFVKGASNIDACERRIASYELRRMAALREIESRNEMFARKLEATSTRIIDAHAESI